MENLINLSAVIEGFLALDTQERNKFFSHPVVAAWQKQALDRETFVLMQEAIDKSRMGT